MNRIFSDRYVLFSLASIAVLILVCAAGPLSAGGTDGNGAAEICGVVSDPSPSQNGTVFKVTDLEGNEIRCFCRLNVPAVPTLCRLTGSFSADGSMFFTDTIVVTGQW
jgi:hypothetical protein